MNEEKDRQQHQMGASHLSQWLCGSPFASPSILLPTIKDQQIYLSLVSTLLSLAREAQAPAEAIEQVGSALLAAKGFHSQKMLRNVNQNTQSYQSRREDYNWLDKKGSAKDMKNLVQKIEKQILQARQKQKQFRCLQKYQKEKEEQIAPVVTNGPSSKKDRFKKIIRNKYSKKSVQSSNFYQFEVAQILQNTFKSQNQCYQTISNFIHLKTLFGHSADQDIESYSQIYNALFDRSQNLIISGGEQGLIKIWHRHSGTLIKTLKGHTDFLNKIQTSKCNKYLLSSGGDGIRFFDLRTLKPLGGWKTGSIDQITSLLDENGRNIFLFGQNSELFLLNEEVMLASSNRQLNRNDFTIFSFQGLTNRQNSAILVLSLSPQKTNLLIGLQTGQFLMVNVSNLLEMMYTTPCGQAVPLPAIRPIKAHYKDIVEIKWKDSGSIFATGSTDGRCCLWEIRQNQVYLITQLEVNKSQKGRKKRTYSCTYICWNCTFSHFAAGFQENVEEEDSQRGQGQVLIYDLTKKSVTCQVSQDISLKVGSIKAMDSHPHYPNILLICQAQGHIILFDLFLGCIVNVFEQRGYHIMHPQFNLIPTECRFSQDGLSFIVSSQYGSVSIYGYDSKMFFSLTPSEQFSIIDFVQIEVETDTMITRPLTLEFDGDINDYPVNAIVTIKGEPYQNIFRVNITDFMYRISNPIESKYHFPQTKLEQSFLDIIMHSLKEGIHLDQSYQKTYQQIQSNKQMYIFHQRQRQFAKINQITGDKINGFRAAPLKVTQTGGQNIQQELPIRSKKYQRKSQRPRVNYADDYFEYNDSLEEDFVQQEAEQMQQMSSDPQDQEQQQPRIRNRERRTVMKRPRRLRNHDQRQLRNYQEEFEDDQPRMPTRKRNHGYQPKYRQQIDEISESAPKRRNRMENEQEEGERPKKYTRLRRQANSEQIQEMADCYRCQIIKATHICHQCPYTQKYCTQCSQLRGKKIKDRYKCYICIYLLNQSHQEYDHLTQQAYRMTVRDSEMYVPQIEDEVRFFFQGYEQFLVQNVEQMNNDFVKSNPDFRLLPHTEDSYLASTPLCRVKTVNFYFPLKGGESQQNHKRNPGKSEPSSIQMLLGLSYNKPKSQAERLNEDESQQVRQVEEQDMFWIYFIPGYEFLIPDSIYRQVMEKDLISKFTNNGLINVKGEEMQIIQISPFQDKHPQSIWKMIKIRKTEGKRLRGNTKQIQKRVNVWNISDQIVYDNTASKLEQKHTDRLISYIQKLKNEDSPFCIFVDYVDFEIYPLYRQQITVGISLLTILDRLKNSYYTGYQSLKADFNRIYENSLSFNGQNHQVTKNAENLRNSLYSVLNSDEEIQIQSHSKKTQEESNSKKEKRNKVVQVQDIIQIQNYGPRTRRTRLQDKKNRKRRESSNYSESEASIEEGFGIATRGGRTRNEQNHTSKRITRSRTKNH